MEYAAPGIRLSLHGRNAERLDVIAEKTRERGAIPLSHVGDVADATALAAWMRACDAQQPIELVIANAGISAGSGGTLETEEQSRAIFATNLAGLLNTIHPAFESHDRAWTRANRTDEFACLLSWFSRRARVLRSQGRCADLRRGAAGQPCSARNRGECYLPRLYRYPHDSRESFSHAFYYVCRPCRACHSKRSSAKSRPHRLSFADVFWVRILAALPQMLLDRLTARMPQKPALDG